MEKNHNYKNFRILCLFVLVFFLSGLVLGEVCTDDVNGKTEFSWSSSGGSGSSKIKEIGFYTYNNVDGIRRFTIASGYNLRGPSSLSTGELSGEFSLDRIYIKVDYEGINYFYSDSFLNKYKENHVNRDGNNFSWEDSLYKDTDFNDFYLFLEVTNIPVCVPECTMDSQCRSDFYSENFCFDDDVYRDFHDFSCLSDSCEEDVNREKVATCGNGCFDGKCLPPVVTECNDNVDNDDDGLIDSEDPGCWVNPLDSTTYDPDLDDESRYTVICDGSSSCCGGVFDGDLFCEGKDVFREILKKLCNNPNTGLSFCDSELSIIGSTFVNSCDYACLDGSCVNECSVDSVVEDCGPETFGGRVCVDNDLHQVINGFSCSSSFMCEDTSRPIRIEDCGDDGFGPMSETYCIDDSVYFNKTFFTRGCAVDDCFELEGITEKVEERECDNGCNDGECKDVDIDGPVVTLIAPMNDSTQHDEISFVFNVSDESTLRNCSLSVNGVVESVLNDVSQIDTNTILFTPSVTNVFYTWSVGCFDIYNNFNVSEEWEFYYTDNFCTVDSDCGDILEDLICQEEDVFKKVVEPVCHLNNNTCGAPVVYEFVRECDDGCLNGRCLGDSHITSDVNYTEDNANNFNPYSGSSGGRSGDSRGRSVRGGDGFWGSVRNAVLGSLGDGLSDFILENTPVVLGGGDGGEDGYGGGSEGGRGESNWWLVALLLLVIGGVFLVLLIFFVNRN